MKKNQHDGVEDQDSGELLLILVLTLVLVGCCLMIESCPNHCNPMGCTMPGFPHHLLELAQTHVH